MAIFKLNFSSQLNNKLTELLWFNLLQASLQKKGLSVNEYSLIDDSVISQTTHTTIFALVPQYHSLSKTTLSQAFSALYHQLTSSLKSRMLYHSTQTSSLQSTFTAAHIEHHYTDHLSVNYERKILLKAIYAKSN